MAAYLSGFALQYGDRLALDEALERRRAEVAAELHCLACPTSMEAPGSTSPPQAAASSSIFGASRLQAYLKSSDENPVHARIALTGLVHLYLDQSSTRSTTSSSS